MLVRLHDGTDVRLRPIAPDDKALLAAGLASLSEQSRYRRFLTAKPRLTGSELRYLTEVDGHDHFALLAVLPDQPDRMAGVGRWVRLAPGSDTAEFAIVVGDSWQGKGLGSALGAALVDAAVEHGVRRFTAVTLPENAPAQRLLEKIAGRLTYEQADGGLRAVQVELAA